ncbi:CNPV165 N1R/p28-like protein [Canarypox virus]|uniref:CNPV165 N1R/p28-like protein n=1 Tax=Canarypox virus TaxID=44088 RepID=Q6VZI2_CNPV|nr:CNPV165 N1R/p28-like protein [Canarypox virus]AAR83511.1 CNPV165 N1R/p28-like protein [Canarypox virus]AWD84641.1 N1R/p28-like protein [Canarypox virus]
MDFSNLVTREIDERFCYIKYDKFELIMMKENGFINATKLCKLGGKDFHRWKRLDYSKELIREVEAINDIWKLKSPPPDLGGVILEVGTVSKGKHQYEVAGSYVHQDLIPHITSWISPSFAIKVSKIINCYVSGKYEFKLKEKENKIDELMELLYEFNSKYDRDTAKLEKYNKRMEEKYDKDTRELKEHNKELSNSVKRMEEKYDRDTRELKEGLRELKEENKELKTELKKIEERLKDKVINPSSPNKLHRLVILQNKRDPNSFKTLRLQAERLDRELDKVKRDYRVFFNAYEPNAVSCFNRLKERLLEQERVKINYNDFVLCDLENYGVRELYNDLQNLDLVRKYT